MNEYFKYFHDELNKIEDHPCKSDGIEYLKNVNKVLRNISSNDIANSEYNSLLEEFIQAVKEEIQDYTVLLDEINAKLNSLDDDSPF